MGLFNGNDKELKKRIHADYSNQSLTALPKDYKQSTHVQKLSCQNNQLSTLPGLLDTFEYLFYVDISENTFSSLPLELPKCLITLNASKNRLFLIGISEGIKKFVQLKGLNLSFNQLDELPRNFDSLSTLQELDLSNNHFAEVPDGIYNLFNLENLNLASNKIKIISQDIQKLRGLKSLNVGGNLISELPDRIGKLSKLKILNASNNILKTVPNTIVELILLEELDLEDNQRMDQLPADMHLMVKLEKLNIKGTSFRELPYSLRGLTLTDIKIRGNAFIKEIPNFIGQLSRLVRFDARYCGIHSIGESIGQLVSLEYLDLRNNELTVASLPDTMSGLQKLLRLQLSNNRLTHLPESLYMLQNLIELDISNNLFIAFSEELGDMYSLQKVCANSNKITHLPQSIGKLKNLSTFEVRMNLIETLCNEIADCSALAKLDLSHNHLRKLPTSMHTLQFLKVLDLSDNPFNVPPQRIIVQGTAEILLYLRLEEIQREGIELSKSERKKLNKSSNSLGGSNSLLSDNTMRRN